MIITGGAVYDPANGIAGEVRDVEISGGFVAAGTAEPPTGKRLSAVGCVVMAGGLDAHSHPLGVSRLARLAGGKELAEYADFGSIASKYISMGVTFFTEAGLPFDEIPDALKQCEIENIGCQILSFEPGGGNRPRKFVGERGLEEFFQTPDTDAVHHVHLPHLAQGESLGTLEKFLKRLSGRRCHLSHVSHYAFETRDGKLFPAGGRAAEMLARYPNVTVDCGPIVFGPALTFTADEDLAHRVLFSGGRGLIGNPKSRFISSPYTFKKENRIDSLLWINGMEFLLSAQNLKSVSLSIDFPSGGAIEGYPHIIACLMDAEKRGLFLSGLNPESVESSSLKNNAREFTLSEIATITRLAPAIVAGKKNRDLDKWAVDAVVYEDMKDREKMFATPRYVIRKKNGD